MRIRILATVIAFSLLAGLVVGPASPAAAKTEIKSLYFFGKDHEITVWAIKKGIVKSDLIDVKFKTGNISALIQAMAARTFDVIETSALAVPLSNARGLPIRVIASGPRVRGGQVIIAKKNSPLSKPADLKGKSIAISSLRSTSVTLMRLVLGKKYGMNIADQGGDIKWKELPLPTIPTAVVRGQLDAGYTLQNFSRKAMESGEFKVILNAVDEYESTFKIQYLPSVWVTYQNVIDKKAAELKEFQRMLHESAQYANRNPDKVLASISKEHEVPQSDLKVLHKWNPMDGNLTREQITSFATFYKLCKEAGILKDYPPVSKMFWLGQWQ